MLLLSIVSWVTKAQSTTQTKIAVSAYVAPNSGVPKSADKVLETKLKNLISAAGFASSANTRFILTAHVTTLTEDVTATAPPQYAYTLSFNLYFGDGVSGNLYSSADFETKGVGTSKEKAYQMALKALNPRNPEFKKMIVDGEQKVIEYYNANGNAIIQEAQTLANNQQYDDALWVLDEIPSVCTDLYQRANELKMSFYQKLIAEEGAKALAEARAAWNAGQDREAANRAGAILATINPQSPAYSEAVALSNQIAARVKALDEREWNYKLQEQKNAADIQKAQIKAIRDIGVAKAQNQPKTIYKVYWW